MLQVYSVNAATGEVAAAYALGMWGTFRPEIGEKFELSDASDLLKRGCHAYGQIGALQRRKLHFDF